MTLPSSLRASRRLIGVAAVVACVLALAGAVPAAASASPQIGGFGVRPAHSDPSNPATRAYFIPTIAPGGTYQDQVPVDSTSPSTLTLLVYPVDGTTGTTSGAVFTNRKVPLHGAGTWITPAVSEVTVPPGGTVAVPFTVAVPPGTSSGDHLGGVAFQRTDPGTSGGKFSVTQVLRAVIGVEVEVPGPARFVPRLSSLALKAIAGTDAASVVVGIGDAGLALGKPGLTVSLTGPRGYHRTVSRRLDTILPGDTIPYPFAWPDALSPGEYTVKAVAAGGPSPVSLHARIRLARPLAAATPVTAPPRPVPAPSGGIPWWSVPLAVVLGALAATLGLRVRRALVARRADDDDVPDDDEGDRAARPSGVEGAEVDDPGSDPSAGPTSDATAAPDPGGPPPARHPAGGERSARPGSRRPGAGRKAGRHAWRRAGSSAVAAACVVAGLLVGVLPASAASLVGPRWTVSKLTTGATSVTYTYTFTTKTGDKLTSVVMTVPAGTGGTPTLGTVSGVTATGVSLGSGVLTVTLSGARVNTTKPVSIEITGLKNTITPGRYTSTITTRGSGTGKPTKSTTVDTGTAGPVSIAQALLTYPSWSTTKTATGAATATYTFAFTTATAAVLTSVSVTVPTGTGGTPTLGTVSGLPASGHLSLTGDVLTYGTFTQSVAAGTSVSLQVTKLKNTATPGVYTSQITTFASGVVVDTAVTPPTSLSTGVLQSPEWAVTTSTGGATSVTYTYTFRMTTTGARLTSVILTVPPGTGGIPTLGTVSGVTATGVSLSGGALAVTLATSHVNGTKTVSIRITGLKNTSVPGSYVLEIATYGNVGGVNTARFAVATGLTAPESISGGTLTAATWSLSSPTVGVTASYTYSFITATAATLASVTMTVPPGTDGTTAAVGTVSGLPGSGSVSFGSDTLTYHDFSQSVAAGTAISIQITHVKNTTTPGSYSSQVTTNSASGPVDTGFTAIVSIAAGSLTDARWSVSSSIAGVTDVAYTYTFTTATGAHLTSVSMTVPPGTTGAPGLGATSGVTATAVSLATDTLTVTLTGAHVTAGKSVSIQITGLTNTSVPGSYVLEITTRGTPGNIMTTPIYPIDSGLTAPESISGGALTNAIWSVSKSTTGATDVDYTYRFTTATPATLASVTMTVPPTTPPGTPTRGTVSGLPDTGTVTLTGNTLTYHGFGSQSVAADTTITIQVTGLTNTPNAGSYFSEITTNSTTGPVDTGSTATLSFSEYALTAPIWSVSSAAAGLHTVTYTYTFVTTVQATLTSVTMWVPPGTGGSPVLGDIINLPDTGTLSLTGGVLTYSFAATGVNPTKSVSIEVTGLTNTSTGGSYASEITTVGTTEGGAPHPVETGLPAPVAITGGALASAHWTVSKSVASTTGVTYTYTFTTGTSATLTSISATVPPGTAGTPLVGTVSGLPGTGHVSLSGSVLTYSTFSQSVTSGTAISIQFKGLTNTSTVGSYTSEVVTYDVAGPVDAGITPVVSISGGTLVSPTWALSKLNAGATGVTYTYAFTVASTATLTSVTMTVPSGTGEVTAAGGAVSGVPAGGAVTLVGTTLTYLFGTTRVVEGVAVSISITGITTTTTAGPYTAEVTTNRTSGGVSSPIDTGTTATVTISLGNPYSVYVADSGSAAVSPVTVGAITPGTAISTGTGTSPWAVAVTPKAVTAYVVNSAAGTLTPVTVSTNTAGTAITLTGCTTPKAVAITPGGATAYVVCAGNDKVVPVTLPGGTVGSAITVGTTPDAVAITPGGGTAYVVNSAAGTLTPVTVSTNTAGTAITLTGCTTPDAVAVTPGGSTAYVTCSGNGKVVPVTLPGGAVGSAITVGTTPDAVAVTPGGSTAYVTNSGSGTVTPITVSTGTPGTAITVGSGPDGVAVTPDGTTAYVANGTSGTVTPITVSTGTPGTAISVGTSPVGVAVTPDQAPVAELSVTPGQPGADTSFDASTSTVAYHAITDYSWTFGDGSTASGSSPTVTHVYAAGCTYTVTLTETDSAGTSTTQVFTGQTMSRNGGPSATTSASVNVNRPFGLVSVPGDISFSDSLNGTDQSTSSTLELDVGDGTATAGWSISATSTTFTTEGTPHRALPTTAVTVRSHPTSACDGSASCTPPTNNSVLLPYVLPAGSTAPTATQLVNAASGHGVCDQTVTPTFTLAVPARAYAGTYSSTWTVTLSSGP